MGMEAAWEADMALACPAAKGPDLLAGSPPDIRGPLAEAPAWPLEPAPWRKLWEPVAVAGTGPEAA